MGIATQNFPIAKSNRRQENEIKGTERSDASWSSKQEDVVEELENYFGGIFSSALPDNESLEAALDGIDARISDTMRAELDSPCTAADVTRALFEMVCENLRGRTDSMWVSIRIIGSFFKQMSLGYISIFLMAINLSKRLVKFIFFLSRRSSLQKKL